PLALFAGSPLYVLYLRALGARIGPGVTILSRAVPVCTDLLTIGRGTIVRKDTYLSCYRPRAGMIQIGPVTLGADVYVGEVSVLDIHTEIGGGGQLGHAPPACSPARRSPAGSAGTAPRPSPPPPTTGPCPR